MSRELEFDGWWEGNAAYSCDNCGKDRKFRFDGEDEAKDYDTQRECLRDEGWLFTKINGRYHDFCSEACRNAFIRRNTI